MKTTWLSLILFLVLALPRLADAHDYWIEPSTYHPAANSLVNLSFRVGQNFQGDLLPRVEKRVVRFVALNGKSVTFVPGPEGKDPVGSVTARGDTMVAYESSNAEVSLPATKFEAYLIEEGLEKIVAERVRRGESAKDGRELYARCPKTLLHVDGKGRGVYARTAGLTLELIPENDPYQVVPSGKLKLRLLFRGKPAGAGVLVVAINKSDPTRLIKQRTNASGRVSLSLEQGGEWLVKAVEMVRSTSPRAEWQSYWASLTFAPRATPPAGRS